MDVVLVELVLVVLVGLVGLVVVVVLVVGGGGSDMSVQHGCLSIHDDRATNYAQCRRTAQAFSTDEPATHAAGKLQGRTE